MSDIIVLKSDSGRIFEVPISLALQFEKPRSTGFLERKEAEYKARYDKKSPEEERAIKVNKQYHYWMRTLEVSWDVEQGGCAITIGVTDPDPGMFPENQTRLNAEGIEVEIDLTYERSYNATIRRLVYLFRRL